MNGQHPKAGCPTEKELEEGRKRMAKQLHCQTDQLLDWEVAAYLGYAPDSVPLVRCLTAMATRLIGGAP